MANEPQQPRREEEEAPERKTRPEETPNRPRSKSDEAREDGQPGYGQPPEEVREKSIPEQKW